MSEKEEKWIVMIMFDIPCCFMFLKIYSHLPYVILRISTYEKYYNAWKENQRYSGDLLKVTKLEPTDLSTSFVSHIVK